MWNDFSEKYDFAKEKDFLFCFHSEIIDVAVRYGSCFHCESWNAIFLKNNNNNWSIVIKWQLIACLSIKFRKLCGAKIFNISSNECEINRLWNYNISQLLIHHIKYLIKRIFVFLLLLFIICSSFSRNLFESTAKRLFV